MRQVGISVISNIITVFSLIIVLGCGGESSGTGLTTGGDGGGTGKASVTILRPSPCQRITEDMVINVEASDTDGIENLYITLDGAVVASFDGEPPFAATVAINKPDGTYILKAIMTNKSGKTKSAEEEIRIDLTTNKMNYLVVDADADPLGLGGEPGAVFRINPDTGHICVLASSKMFSDPAGIGILNDGTIFVSDYSADMNGSWAGVGTLFKVFPDRFNGVEVLSASGLFRAPVGLDVTANSIFVADYDACPSSSLNCPDPDHGPGAIFAVHPSTGAVTTAMTNAKLISPIGVTVDISGDLWVVDSDYDLANQNDGSVWRYNRTTGLSFVASSPDFVTPFMVKPISAGKLVLADSGDRASGNLGKMFEIDLTTSPATVTLLKSGAPFVTPSGFIYLGADSFMIADRDADIDNRGAILDLDPALNLSILYESEMFVTPMGIILSPY